MPGLPASSCAAPRLASPRRCMIRAQPCRHLLVLPTEPHQAGTARAPPLHPSASATESTGEIWLRATSSNSNSARSNTIQVAH